MDHKTRELFELGSYKEKRTIIEQQKLPNDLIERIIEGDEKDLIADLIYNQVMTVQQHLKILSSNDFDLLWDRFEMYAEELNLPNEVIEIIIRKEEYKSAQSALISKYPLSQTIINEILHKEKDYWEIYSIIESQGLRDSLIHYILDDKVSEIASNDIERLEFYEKYRDVLIFNQTLPEELITRFIDNRENIDDLIHGQRLSNHQIMRILSDEELENYHYEDKNCSVFFDAP